MDFLKMYPSLTIQDYIWGLSAPMIKIMTSDATQVLYLSEKQQQEYKRYKMLANATEVANNDLDAFVQEFNIPTI